MFQGLWMINVAFYKLCVYCVHMKAMEYFQNNLNIHAATCTNIVNLRIFSK